RWCSVTRTSRCTRRRTAFSSSTPAARRTAGVSRTTRWAEERSGMGRSPSRSWPSTDRWRQDRRMDLDVLFVGTAGSAPTPARGLPALLVRRGGDRLLFDCGEGTQRQLLRSIGLVDLEEIYVTHFHADHFLGLPGMLKTFALRGRERPLTVYGPPGLQSLFQALRPIVGRVAFDLTLVELEPNEELRRDGF